MAEHLRLKHEVLSAKWSDEIHQWQVTIKNIDTGEVFVDTAHFFVEAAGRLNVPKFPNIPGLDDRFKGTVVHTSQWTDDLTREISGKRIAVIGNGASGQQFLANIIDKPTHVDHYVRSRQWIVPAFSPTFVAATKEVLGGYVFTQEEKDRFVQDPQAYLEYRKSIEKGLHGRFEGTILGSESNNKAWENSRQALWERLGGDQAWFARLVPSFAPGCKRPTPSAGYIEAIQSSKVDYVDDVRISHATADGLVTEDGTERKVDMIVTATGFKNGFLPLFPTIGKDGRDLSKYWATNGPIGYPKTYFGIMAPKIPNWFAVVQVSTHNLSNFTAPLTISRPTVTVWVAHSPSTPRNLCNLYCQSYSQGPRPRISRHIPVRRSHRGL